MPQEALDQISRLNWLFYLKLLLDQEQPPECSRERFY
jgi:hypothetical protein